MFLRNLRRLFAILLATSLINQSGALAVSPAFSRTDRIVIPHSDLFQAEALERVGLWFQHIHFGKEVMHQARAAGEALRRRGAARGITRGKILDGAAIAILSFFGGSVLMNIFLPADFDFEKIRERRT